MVNRSYVLNLGPEDLRRQVSAAELESVSRSPYAHARHKQCQRFRAGGAPTTPSEKSSTADMAAATSNRYEYGVSCQRISILGSTCGCVRR